jgi:biotin carboxylase
MVLGGGLMQLPALRRIRANGWHAIVVDGNDRCAGRELADAFEHIDLKAEASIADAASRYAAQGKLDGVFTAGTDFSTSVAYVCDQLALPGIGYDVALRARDKVRMRSCFSEQGVPSPRFSAVRTADLEKAHALSHIPDTLGFPLVVKPVDNMGARGVRRVQAASELRPAVTDALSYSASGTVIVEERIHGPEYSLDAIVSGGTVAVCGIADRHIRFPPHFVEVGHTLPADLTAGQASELERVFKLAIRAIGIENGAAKGDIFLTENGGVVGEVAARLSGGYMSGWTYPLATGVDVTEAALRIALGRTPGELRPRRTFTSAERAFLSIPGVVQEIHGLEEAKGGAFVQEQFTTVRVGDTVRFPRNNVEKCGNIIATAPTRSEAVSSAERAVGQIVLYLQPGIEATARFLYVKAGPGGDRAGTEERPADAFQLSEEQREEIFRLPAGTLESGGRTVHPFDTRAWGRDWSYRSGEETVELLFRRYGLRFVDPGERATLGSEFWQALAAGGVQGGAYLIESIDADADTVRQTVRAWRKRPA